MATEATKIPFVEAAAPATPAASRVVVYAKADGLMYSKDDAGAETLMSGGSSGAVATDAIWDAAGDLAVGTGANTAAKMTIGAAGGAVSRVNGAVAWNSGTSFPTAATGDRYWRTDLGDEFYYDGTRWLSTQLYTAGTSVAALAATAAFYFPLRTAYDIYVVDLVAATFPAGTNDGSNFWTILLAKSTAGNTPTTIETLATTAADTDANWTNKVGSVNEVVDQATYRILDITFQKTAAAGTLFAGAFFTYRRIAT